MATRMGLREPSVFLQDPGEPAVPWTQWFSAFENYVLAMGGSDCPAPRKKALLLHCLGLEGQRIYNSLPPRANPPEGSNDYKDAVFVLESHFKPRVNVVAMRHRFRQRSQQPGESVDMYIAALRDLCNNCKFDSMDNPVDEMIRDQLVEKTISSKVREKLLMESDLTLDKAITLARTVEETGKDIKILSGHSSVNAVMQKKSPSVKKSTKSSAHYNKPNFDGQSKFPSRYCFRCGSPNHLANSSTCVARNKQCSVCGKMGHFGKYCRTPQASDPNKRKSTVNEVVCESSDESDYNYDDIMVLATDGIAVKQRPVYCTVKINHIPHRIMVDTGSGVTLISNKFYRKHFVQEALEEPDQQLSSYTSHPIHILGALKASVMYKNRVVICNLYVVNNDKSILGRDLITALQLSVTKVGNTLTCDTVSDNCNDTESVHMSKSDIVLPSYLSDFQDMFQEQISGKLNIIKGFVHKVKVNDKVEPVQQKLHRLPFSIRDKVSQELKRLENLDVIEKIDSSEWVSPIVVSWKKNNTIRICVDLRQVNKAVIPDRYPLPKIDELISELRNAKYFSQLDLASAYHQMLLHPKSRNLTAFITHNGVYRYKRLCFGLSSAPSAFQKMLSTILSDLKGVQNYLDDVIVYGKDKVEHDKNLYEVMSKLQSCGILLNYDKCKFGQSSIEFLGHKITGEGIQIDDKKCQALYDMPAPSDVKTLKSYLGLAGYFSSHIPQFASIAEPLRALLHKNTKFEWSSKEQQSFENIRKLVKENLVLAMFDPDLETIVTTDAAGGGLGAVISQIKAGKEVIVSCASRTLSANEKKYSIGEKEALACLWACKKWHTYLWGRKFTLCTDHQALVTLLSKGSDRASMRIARWSCKLLNYNYEVKYKKGCNNILADTLSRLPVTSSESEYDTDDEVICQLTLTELCKSVSLKELKKVTNDDKILNEVKTYIEHGWPKKNLSKAIRSFHHVKDELVICNDILMRNDRIVVPDKLTSRFLYLAHESHQGMTRTKQRLRGLYWWPQMDTQVELLVKHCTLCRCNDKTATPSRVPMEPVKFPNSAWSKLAMDIVGPFDIGSADCKYAITLIDYYSKWPEVSFVSSVTTNKIIEFLKNIFAREGFPSEIITDHGVQFTSHEFKNYLESRGIKHGFSSVYFPQSNGAIERFNVILKNVIQNAVNSRRLWKECVLQFLAIYRATPQSTTKLSPSVLLHKRQMRTRLHIIGYDHIDGNIENILKCVPDTVEIMQNKYKHYYDTKHNVKNINLQVGDWVRVRKPGFITKGRKVYSDPVQVKNKLSRHTYVLSDGKSWNISKLVKCKKPDVEPTEIFDDMFDSHDDPIVNVPQPQPSVNTPVLRRSSRHRQPPKYLKDYVT